MQKTKIDIRDGDVTFISDWLSGDEARAAFDTLQKETPWAQKPIQIYGKEFMQPWLTAWYGDANATYTYSNAVYHPLPWTPFLSTFRTRFAEVGFECNSVLLNLYRNGNDSIGYHSDDERELGVDPTIFSLSLGASRLFQLRHRNDMNSGTDIELTNGSLLIMQGQTQRYWKHALPKRPKVAVPRINLTFRKVYPL